METPQKFVTYEFDDDEETTETPAAAEEEEVATDEEVKVSLVDKKMRRVQIKTLLDGVSERVAALMTETKAEVDAILSNSASKPAAKKKPVKKNPVVSYDLETIHPPCVKTFLQGYTKSTISQRDLLNTVYAMAFTDQYLDRSPANFKALALSKVETQILGKLSSNDHVLNVSKSDNKVLLNKLVKFVPCITIEEETYNITDANLWDRWVEAGLFIKSQAADEVVYWCPNELGMKLKEQFSKKPAFTNKKVTVKTFQDYCDSIAKRQVQLFYAIPANNIEIFKFFGVEYVRVEDVCYTKYNLLKAAVQKRIDPASREFTPETKEFLEKTFPTWGYDVGKPKTDDVITRFSYSTETTE